jgi:hypothetical protein
MDPLAFWGGRGTKRGQLESISVHLSGLLLLLGVKRVIVGSGGFLSVGCERGRISV